VGGKKDHDDGTTFGGNRRSLEFNGDKKAEERNLGQNNDHAG